MDQENRASRSLARLAASDPDLLPPELHASASPLKFAPVLFVGEREPIGKGVLRALDTTVTRILGKVPRRLAGFLSADRASEPLSVIGAIEAVTQELSSREKPRACL
jgi:hypothetical protein